LTEINSIGGSAKQYQVAPNAEKLASYGITLAEIVTALDRNNSNLGAGDIERRGEQLLVQTPRQVRTLEDIGNIVVRSADGVAIRIQDVAEVGIGKELRTGAATENGQEVVLGTVFMLMGENSRTVARAVDAKMAEINQTLPEGVRAVPVYDRTILVDKAIHTVQKNLMESAALVIAILFLFLGNIRAAIITAMVIPLALLFTFSGMVTTKVSANLLSFGAIDLGLVADGAIVLAENSIKRLAHAQSHHGRPPTQSERFREVFAAAREVRRPLLYGHCRNCLGPDATRYLGRLHHGQAGKRTAGAEEIPWRAANGNTKDRRETTRKQLRVFPASPTPVRRADLGHSQRRGSQAVR
jgi:cobalt-zinc-cadmium resistance protein CzcA